MLFYIAWLNWSYTVYFQQYPAVNVLSVDIKSQGLCPVEDLDQKTALNFPQTNRSYPVG